MKEEYLKELYKWAKDKGIISDFIDYYDKNQRGFPSNMDELAKLTTLNLSSFDLASINLHIFKLQNLEHLILTDNKIEVIPPEIENLKDLKSLDISKNKISQLSSEICNLSDLHHLSLEENDLTKLPEDMINLKKLTYLYWDIDKVKLSMRLRTHFKNIESAALKASE